VHHRKTILVLLLAATLVSADRALPVKLCGDPAAANATLRWFGRLVQTLGVKVNQISVRLTHGHTPTSPSVRPQIDLVMVKNCLPTVALFRTPPPVLV